MFLLFFKKFVYVCKLWNHFHRRKVVKKEKETGKEWGNVAWLSVPQLPAHPTMALPWEGQKGKLYKLKNKESEKKKKKQEEEEEKNNHSYPTHPFYFVSLFFYPRPLHHSSPLFSLPIFIGDPLTPRVTFLLARKSDDH
jgi:hypothetical protein